MRDTVGAALAILGWILGGIVWLATTVLLWLSGDTGLALLAFFFPPADVVLSFVVAPALGVAAVAAVALVMCGAAVGAAR
jgi:hypothetical protein